MAIQGLCSEYIIYLQKYGLLPVSVLGGLVPQSSSVFISLEGPPLLQELVWKTLPCNPHSLVIKP